MHRYEQVDHPSDKAVTLTFGTNGGRDRGGVTGPTKIILGQQMAVRTRQPGSLTPTKAFAMAEELADHLGLPLVVVDPNGIWNPVWGELYRPATGRDPLLTARFPAEMIKSIEAWAATNGVTRTEAIPRLVELGLSGGRQPMPRRSPKSTSEATDMAGRQIDRLGDSSATYEERQTRKRRLLKGPKESRDIRLPV
jgi:hypothetical protein